MAYRSSAPERTTTERWDRDRYEHERDRDRYGDVRERFEEDDDHVYVRRTTNAAGPNNGPRPASRPAVPRDRDRDDRERLSSVGPSDRDRDREWDRERRFRGRDGDDEVVIRERSRSRERRRVVYEDEPSGPPLRRRAVSPPPAEFRRHVSPPPEFRRRPVSPLRGEVEVEKSRVVIEKERYRSPSPGPRAPPRLVRRQSSLDTFDRRPAKRYWEREREEYGPPARREDHRIPPYVDIPLPRTKALPPPRVYAEREYVDEIQVSDPHRYGDEDFHAYPERVREREIVRTRRRTRSRDSRVRRRSRSSSSSSSSSSGGTALTVKSEYPKKGKTRIPARLVSKRALIDLGYPFVEEVR
jgi:hypothetical protein